MSKEKLLTEDMALGQVVQTGAQPGVTTQMQPTGMPVQPGMQMQPGMPMQPGMLKQMQQ